MRIEELKELIIAWLATSLAFGILITREGELFSKTILFSKAITIATITVGLGFVAHELAHRYMAHRFGKHAEFKANNIMLFLSVITSFLGFVLAAPGAVVISGFVNRKEGGIIASMGPAANLAIAILFVPFLFIFPSIAFYGMMINAWLALFNLIPFLGFDGQKIVEWNKLAYFGMLALAILLNIAHIIIQNLNFIK
jgi:Zn-dependent protease